MNAFRTNSSANSEEKSRSMRYAMPMAGIRGKSGPPANQNAFKHGLAAVKKRGEEAFTTDQETGFRKQILEGLLAVKGGDMQLWTATLLLPEVIASSPVWI